MKKVIVKITGVSPISFSRMHGTEKTKKEAHDDYERRTWRNKVHEIDGDVVITPFMVMNMLSDIAKYLGMQIPGKGKATYTKHFDAGVLINDHMTIGIKKEDVQGQWRSVPSNGKPGPGPRVSKCFPVIPEWSGTMPIYILDDTITTQVLLDHMDEAGKFIGMGSFRPRNRGIFGRFNTKLVSDSDVS